jgi:hypothetical protein
MRDLPLWVRNDKVNHGTAYSQSNNTLLTDSMHHHSTRNTHSPFFFILLYSLHIHKQSLTDCPGLDVILYTSLLIAKHSTLRLHTDRRRFGPRHLPQHLDRNSFTRLELFSHNYHLDRERIPARQSLIILLSVDAVTAKYAILELRNTT